MKTSAPRYFPASVIARAAQCDKATVHRRAVRKGWPRRRNENRLEYQPPFALRKKCRSIFQRSKPAGFTGFVVGAERRAEAWRAETRFAALRELEAAMQNGMPVELALVRVARDFTFHASARSLRCWQRHFAKKGFAGLLESKRGHSGTRHKARR